LTVEPDPNTAPQAQPESGAHVTAPRRRTRPPPSGHTPTRQ
jgi:hypothetical protein